MKNFLSGFFAGCVLLVLGTAAYLGLGYADVRSDSAMPPWAKNLSSIGIHASIRRTAPGVQNPLPPGEQTLIAGGKLYLNDCVGCHGELGKPPSQFGASFYPPAPQFPLVGTQYSQNEVFWIAKHGIRRTGMGAQADSYSDQQLWTLAAFIVRMPNLPPAVLSGIQPKPAS
jgi:mono/diheme cytochrome c family protein